ncbi:MAG: GtrA-like protein [candidate division WS2 bacterium ADurb.Bin280]|uniref:GtrA-like protein n=1 Tax=candidate division WS2 bacterium ADurb.Bin280 TaxID=1852829 RepID=A0A1V5SEQ9_9BACT|nr:MAG: GtrA-like protein [candidate division WS2 bacterium ADurb.Bin280]
MKDKKKLIIFFVIAGINTVFGYLLFALLIYLNLNLYLAIALAMIGGIIFNFNTYGRLVFKSFGWHKIFSFALVYGLTYLVNIVMIQILKNVISSIYFVQLILVVPIGLMVYFLNKRFVFKGAEK